MPESRDTWIGNWRGRSTVRNSHLYLTGPTWKSLAHSEYKAWGMSKGLTGPASLAPCQCPTTLSLFAVGRRASLGSGCCSPSSLFSLGTCFSSPYQDLARHIVNTSMADVRLFLPLFCCYSWGGGEGGRQVRATRAQVLQELCILTNGHLVIGSQTDEPRPGFYPLTQVMAACSDNLHNLFSRQATAGWK